MFTGTVLLIVEVTLLFLAALLIEIARRLGQMRGRLNLMDPEAYGRAFQAMLDGASKALASYAHDFTALVLVQRFRSDPGLVNSVPGYLREVVAADLVAEAEAVEGRLAILRLRLAELQRLNGQRSVTMPMFSHNAEIAKLEEEERGLKARLGALRDEGAGRSARDDAR